MKKQTEYYTHLEKTKKLVWVLFNQEEKKEIKCNFLMMFDL